MKRFLFAFLAATLLCGLSACGISPVSASSAVPSGSLPAPSSTSVPQSASASQSVSAPVSRPQIKPISGPYLEAVPYRTGEHETPVLYDAPQNGTALATLPAGTMVLVLDASGANVFCCWGSYAGWLPASTLVRVPAENSTPPMPIPQFLTEEQQLAFVQASMLFEAYSVNTAGFVGIGTTGPMVELAESVFFQEDVAYASTAALRTALESVFTPDFVKSDFVLDNENSRYMIADHDGKFYVGERARGSWTAEVHGYTLTAQSTEEITFLTELYFGTAQKFHCSLPVQMVKTPNGWRFSTFTTAGDDTHWIPAMGDDFDPWAAKGNA